MILSINVLKLINVLLVLTLLWNSVFFLVCKSRKVSPVYIVYTLTDVITYYSTCCFVEFKILYIKIQYTPHLYI